jgi:toxin FitB
MTPRIKRATSLALVDSCGWLEYVAGGANAAFFEAALLDTPRLIVPALCLYEVLEMMQQGRVVQLDGENLFAAAQASVAHGLAMADAIIWQTAHTLGATLYTQDAGLQAMQGVSYQLKSKGK